MPAAWQRLQPRPHYLYVATFRLQELVHLNVLNDRAAPLDAFFVHLITNWVGRPLNDMVIHPSGAALFVAHLHMYYRPGLLSS